MGDCIWRNEVRAQGAIDQQLLIRLWCWFDHQFKRAVWRGAVRKDFPFLLVEWITNRSSFQWGVCSLSNFVYVVHGFRCIHNTNRRFGRHIYNGYKRRLFSWRTTPSAVHAQIWSYGRSNQKDAHEIMPKQQCHSRSRRRKLRKRKRIYTVKPIEVYFPIDPNMDTN